MNRAITLVLALFCFLNVNAQPYEIPGKGSYYKLCLVAIDEYFTENSKLTPKVDYILGNPIEEVPGTPIQKVEEIIYLGDNTWNITIGFKSSEDFYPTLRRGQTGYDLPNLGIGLGSQHTGGTDQLTFGGANFTLVSTGVAFRVGTATHYYAPKLDAKPGYPQINGYAGVANGYGRGYNGAYIFMTIKDLAPENNNQSDKSSDGGSSIVGAVVGAVVGVVAVIGLVAVAAFFFIYRRKRTESSQSRNPAPAMTSSYGLPSQQPDATHYESIKPKVALTESSGSLKEKDERIDAGHLKLNRVIGSGQFGEVYVGEWNGTQVALKSMKEGDIATLAKEVEIMKRLNHPNIVRYYGMSTELAKQTFIVTEFCDGGDLKNTLIMKKDELPFPRLVSFMIDICKGMIYLHQSNIVHRDLAARNILVSTVGSNGDFIAKVADFGMSRKVENYYKQEEARMLPIRWVAPEVFTHGLYTTHSDVWSFGVVLWEILEYGRIPYTDMDHQQVINYILNGERLPQPKNCPSGLWNLIMWCFNAESKERPVCTDVLVQLRSFK